MDNKNTNDEQGPDSSGYEKFKDIVEKTGDGVKKTADIIYESSKKIEPRITISFLNKFLAWIKQVITPEKFEEFSHWFVRHGHTGLIAAQIICVFFAIFGSWKIGSLKWFPLGLLSALLIAIMQYIADKFLNAGKELIESSPSKLGSSVFPECLALLTTTLGFLLCIGAFFEGKLVIGLGFLGLASAVALIALNPDKVNVKIVKKIRAGEEAIGIMSFIIKLVVCLVPIAFGIGSIVFTAALLLQLILLLWPFNAIVSPDGCLTAIKLIVACTCLPFATYVLFAFFHLLFDILRAILVLPNKLDKLSK